MKTLLAGLTIISVLAFGTIAFSHGPGGWGGGHMMGQGSGGRMMEDCPGPGNRLDQDDQKFLDETTDLRKEFHNKRFEYAEAVRKPGTDPDTIKKLEKELDELGDKIHEKSPRTYRGYGHMW